MFELIAVATMTVLAVVSPGADFAMVTRNSLLHGRAAGLLSSLGIATGVLLHVFYTLIGVGLLIRNTPEYFAVIQWAGALYLIYVGYQTCFTPVTTVTDPAGHSAQVTHFLRPLAAFRIGFLTNATNPKTTLFVLSVYTQVVSADTSIAMQLGYGVFMSLAHACWFSAVALLLSEHNLRAQLLLHQKWVNRIIGVVLATLGVALLLSPVQ